MKKKLLSAALAMCVGFALGGCGDDPKPQNNQPAAAPAVQTAPAAAEHKDNSGKAELKWASVHPQTQTITQMMLRAIDEINQKAEGIHITAYPNGTLGGSSDVVEAVQEGMVEIITEGPAQFQAWIPKASQVEAPFLWRDVDHMVSTLNGEYRTKLNELFDSINVRILGSLYYGTRQLTTNKPVSKLDDLKGMKIRVPQTDLYIKMVESWGAAATPMNINELYMALQTGTVDGQENPLTTYESYKFYEVVKNITLTNHIICPNMIFINKGVWEKMSAGDQKIVQEAIDNAIAWQNAQIIEAEKTLAEKLKEKGVEIYTPDESIREATTPAIKPLIEDWDLIQSYK